MKRGKIMWNKVALLAGIVVGACLFCGAVVLLVGPSLNSVLSRWLWKTDPDLAAQTAHAMLDYALPPGYQEQQVFQIKQIQDYAQASVVIVSNEHPGDLIMFQESTIEGLFSNPEWRGEMEEGAGGRILAFRYKVETVEIQNVTIKGQSNTLRIMEGTDQNGRQVRQAITVVQGVRGQVLIVIVGGLDTWDQEMVDQFLGSIQ